MKVKGLFVAPYIAMEHLVQECQKDDTELDLTIKTGNLQEGIKFAKEAEEKGYDVIISRGGTARMIEKAVNIPVVDVNISGYDMLRVLTLAKDFPGKKAIVGFSNITRGAKAITDLLEITFDMFTINDKNEIEPLVKRLKSEGFQLIMGDVITINAVSTIGMNGILIQSGKEAIYEAFQKAKSIHQLVIKHKDELKLLSSILGVAAKDIIVLSEHGDIVYENWKGFSERPVTVEQLTNIIKAMDKTNIIQCNDCLIKIATSKIKMKTTSYIVCKVSKMKESTSKLQSLNIKVLHSTQMLVTESETMRTCLAMIQRHLSHNHFILIGENGTGKELVAQYIHYKKFQSRKLYASIRINDFMDMNIDELDSDVKTIYIHSTDCLQEGVMESLSPMIQSLKDKEVTVILALTRENPLLGELIYDDSIVRINLPTLSERKEDIRELVTLFMTHYHQTLGTSAVKIKNEGLSLLMHYNWPGNVEELKMFIKDIVLMEKGYIIDEQLIETQLHRKELKQTQQMSTLLSGTLEEIEKRIIELVLEEEHFNQTKVAKRLNINRSTLWRKLKK
ncbi:PrpR N-terminal domain-containing protein [Heyndrickxia ginsengihumi]|uniref:sigma-54-dependent Fis family transcriptional regulator n=1 Tax=Heyndrickxia ginsengihumi TaxID=363870 RepID=UPI003D1B5E41